MTLTCVESSTKSPVLMATNARYSGLLGWKAATIRLTDVRFDYYVKY